MTDDPVAASHRYDQKVDATGLPEVLAGLVKGVKSARRVNRQLQVGGVMLALLFVAVALLAYRANSAAEKASRAQNSLRVTCESSNQARQTETALWNFVLTVPAAQPRTAAQIAEINTFKSFLATNLAQRDCSKVTG